MILTKEESIAIITVQIEAIIDDVLPLGVPCTSKVQSYAEHLYACLFSASMDKQLHGIVNLNSQI